MSIIRIYTIKLFCDNPHSWHPLGNFPHIFEASTEQDCERLAEAAGWVLTTGNTYCSLCRGERIIGENESV